MKITESSLRQLIRTILLSENSKEEREKAAALRNLQDAAKNYNETKKKKEKKEEKEITDMISDSDKEENIK